jgi:hypothetical protein
MDIVMLYIDFVVSNQTHLSLIAHVPDVESTEKWSLRTLLQVNNPLTQPC